ncbi:hypothetical protein KM043_009243 [Ampulex compressa]|nr:hypothetical protein KM043_009243 [Ampulex compressa]
MTGLPDPGRVPFPTSPGISTECEIVKGHRPFPVAFSAASGRLYAPLRGEAFGQNVTSGTPGAVESSEDEDPSEHPAVPNLGQEDHGATVAPPAIGKTPRDHRAKVPVDLKAHRVRTGRRCPADKTTT